MRAAPTRYRVVVLTSCHCSESGSQPSIIVLMVKLHQHGLISFDFEFGFCVWHVEVCVLNSRRVHGSTRNSKLD